ncbi:hypothetical protein C7N43_25250 [Sphingobacteriales bacterium UPWRP_1]|nr:hypothetical protein BVG80_17365 [Sphingobacteriales bacterium TSM_CSM]PSJ74203.1 hypothetical protein C7N43_25250 [Sphingobacteriales bacterium UPWRP_1]
MVVLTKEMARQTAELYVNMRYKPFDKETKSTITIHYVVVGKDEQHEPPIYADLIPVNTLLIENDETANKLFWQMCKPDEEYLIKVVIYLSSKKMQTVVISSPF